MIGELIELQRQNEMIAASLKDAEFNYRECLKTLNAVTAGKNAEIAMLRSALTKIEEILKWVNHQ